jgi:hypothetical protein
MENDAALKLILNSPFSILNFFVSLHKITGVFCEKYAKEVFWQSKNLKLFAF